MGISDSFRIGRFSPDYLPAFDALNRTWLVSHGLIEPHDEEQLQNPWREILDPGGEIFVALDGARVIGVCAVIPHGAQTMELAKLAVDPSAQGQGIGRRLVEKCVEFARDRGATRLVLVSSSKLTSALRLYESMGFQHGPLPHDVQYETADIYMELALS